MDTPTPAVPTRTAPTGLRTDRDEWRRKTQSSGYIHRVKSLSRLLQAYAPHRLTPALRDSRDDADRPQVYTDKDRAEAIHYFLVPMVDERRSARRDRA